MLVILIAFSEFQNDFEVIVTMKSEHSHVRFVLVRLIVVVAAVELQNMTLLMIMRRMIANLLMPTYHQIRC